MRRLVVPWFLVGGLLWGQVVSGSLEGVFGYVRAREWVEDWLGEEWLEKGMEGRVRVELGDEGGRGVVLVGVEGMADDVGGWEGEVVLYEGYVEQGVGEWGAVRVGRQVVPLGVCYGVHPVDGLHRWRGEDAVGVDGVGVRVSRGAGVWGAGFVGMREGDGVEERLVWAGMVDGWVGDVAEVGVSVVWREDEVERPGGWVSVGVGEVVGAVEVAWEGVEGAWLGAGSLEWVRGWGGGR
ncbi:hypothetical protein [Spirochaeta thermophila]|uniref:Uncharacterized protein n=1 Tax=Winmispira thermophila (strain ATCC 49972 / DSM 6192 / RI 19.B1) TaxID=665571 RepID=E0RRR5_WINT6|nr:hypothetical protein [Spirochaeta thermophila]ADN03169.1 hypothetical protein STHERM_c22470 [Spirochaeta thermophila DSM 6192]